MSAGVVVVGAGGFGREAVDVLQAMLEGPDAEKRLLGVVDDAPSQLNLERLATRGVSYLGTVSDLLASHAPAEYVLGVGAPSSKRALSDRFDAALWQPATLRHPLASVGSDVAMGPGTVVCAGVRITTNVRIGRHVHLNLNSTVGHDTVIGDFVSINPLVAVSGDCTLETEVMLGTGAAVLQGVTVGRGATVGASACVVKDVPPDLVVKGIPAR